MGHPGLGHTAESRWTGGLETHEVQSKPSGIMCFDSLSLINRQRKIKRNIAKLFLTISNNRLIQIINVHILS